MKKKEGLSFPVFMILSIALTGVGLFCLYVVLQVVENIPFNFSMPWYINLIPIICLVIAIVIVLWIKKNIVEEG